MNDFSDLFERFVRISPSDLSREDAERLAQLIQSDSRLCLQLPQSFNHQRDRSQFARALNRSWVEEEYAEVLDYRRKLLRSAAQHRRQRAPIIALLLYATWIEHTINVVIIGSGRLNSLSAGSVDDMARRIVATDFTSRVTKMWTRYKAPKLERTQRTKLINFMELRNEMVHYKWIGLHPAGLEASLGYMRTMVQGAPRLVRYLRGIERQVSTQQFRPRIRRLLHLGVGRKAASSTR